MSEALLIKNIGLLQTPEGRESLCGAAQGQNRKLRNAAVLVENGVISAVTENDAVPPAPAGAEEIDAGGKLVTPSLVDCHTHLIFGGWRQHEIPLKLKGAGYLDILAAGGGILSTVEATRKAGADELYDKAFGFLDELFLQGVTTVEAKSGYGLDVESEIKQLNVIRRLQETHRVDVIPTFLGAHAVPREYLGRTDEYISLVCREMIPAVAYDGLAEYCDVFCEKGVFDAAQSRRVLATALKFGMRSKIHADEIEEIGGAALAGELYAVSCEHLAVTGEAGIEALARGGVTAVLLPGTSFYLNKGFADARGMIGRGVPVAVATDFNPGSCPSLNIGLCMTLAYLKYRMTPEEILTAVTLNAACAVGRGNVLGSVEIGKRGALVVWDAPDVETLCYRFGSNLAKTVVAP
ncbi:MAG TPA: imidazolonepropionase [Clostridia bacterium]|nr:imidazolonepropionase [Clostridia bacterium]